VIEEEEEIDTPAVACLLTLRGTTGRFALVKYATVGAPTEAGYLS
jgi:hypothetical protein